MRADEALVNEIRALWYPDGHMNEDQRDFFVRVLSETKPRACLEVGFASGRSAVTTLVAARPDVLVSIDASLDYIPGARAHAERLAARFPNLRIVEGDSSQVLTAEFLARHFPRGIDFAFVDGDHTYAGCRSDLEAVIGALNPTAIVLVDDYRSGPPNGAAFPSVTAAVDDFVLRHGLVVDRWSKAGKGIAVIRRPRRPLDRWRSAVGIGARTLARGLARIARAARRHTRGVVSRRSVES